MNRRTCFNHFIFYFTFWSSVNELRCTGTDIIHRYKGCLSARIHFSATPSMFAENGQHYQFVNPPHLACPSYFLHGACLNFGSASQLSVPCSGVPRHSSAEELVFPVDDLWHPSDVTNSAELQGDPLDPLRFDWEYLGLTLYTTLSNYFLPLSSSFFFFLRMCQMPSGCPGHCKSTF